ncbi:hypothetical protein ONS95_006101 [Cadophora gregata]|uniref:uncharacterized protein n=1 Tax=Cadophora gregata TaxID=51156 RepID=UPI0026DC3E4F|nr:uncharacterized protein ONS95_006101 [Cadophora gregata]KAK0102485.1 hypothetical protein ONS95_006101 [Cadophora gregata]KAK0104114.1 hypothetical protein ONS96_005210 [Cadophora gregata f. sp. sojae]
MATPTASKPGAGQAVATPPVSTPFSASNHPSHPAFSPHGPRSVMPSPQQVKKSPANSNTMYGYPGGGHPTNSSFGVGYDSPSAAMALGVPGLELGLEGLPGGMGTPVGGVSLGHLGGARADEDERKRRLGQVMDILKVSKGRLSGEGVERLGLRLGFECMWDSTPPGAPRLLIIAGKALALDITFDRNVVQKVALSFPESPEIVTRHSNKAEDILLRDVQCQTHESPLTKKLDRFAANLEILATLDKLSVIPGLNCHEAIAGIFESVERLHLWEVERLKETQEMAEKDDAYVIKTAMCTKSGKPIMHTRDRLGMSLDYWQEKRKLSSNKEEKTWSLLVDCAPLPGLNFTPIRVSEHWISADIQKANATVEDMLLEPDNGPVLDWLDPDNTMLPSADAPKPDAIDGVEGTTDQKFPEVMFVAKFDPPLVVPYMLATQIYDSTSAPIDHYATTTFDELMFPRKPEDEVHTDGRRITRESKVTVYSKDGEKSTVVHRSDLWIDKIDYGRTLTELPFSHPRQLVQMLPALRQYAFLSTLLSKSFGSKSQPPSKPPQKTEIHSKRAQFADFMSGISINVKTMDVSLTTQPHLRLRTNFPFKKVTVEVTFEINLNGAVEVVYESLLREAGDRGKGMTAKDLARMLEVAEDLGIWLEFVKRRLG